MWSMAPNKITRKLGVQVSQPPAFLQFVPRSLYCPQQYLCVSLQVAALTPGRESIRLINLPQLLYSIKLPT